MAAVEPIARQPLSTGELVSLASQEASKTHLAGLPKEVVETVDTAVLVDDIILPVHQLVLSSSSAVLRDLLSSQVTTLQASQVHMVPLRDDGQDCVQDALAFIYQRMLLSVNVSPPEVASITKAKHLAKFGLKYGVQVLLDDSDAFISNWCKTHLSKLQIWNLHTTERKQHATIAAQEVVDWRVFAEGANLGSTLVACESWFVQHMGPLTRHLENIQLNGILAKMSSDMLARIMSAVAKKIPASM